jgi:carboxymethylenebutenolidase
MKKKYDMVFVFVFCIIASLLSTTDTIYKVPHAYAQTNAGMLSATMLATRNNGITNDTVSNTSSATAKEGLQIDKVKNFDSAYGYLVYPSTSATSVNSSTAPTSKKLPAVIMIHEYWGLNDNIRSMARVVHLF